MLSVTWPTSSADNWGRPKKRGRPPKNHKQKNGKGRAENGEKPPPPPRDHVEKANKLKTDLLKGIENLGRKLPPNTLDQLIDELGGPENVAEMTGRKGRVVQSDDGQVMYESRSEADVPLEILNIRGELYSVQVFSLVLIVLYFCSYKYMCAKDNIPRNLRKIYCKWSPVP